MLFTNNNVDTKHQNQREREREREGGKNDSTS